MPAGRRMHKIREYQRRIDAVLEEEREHLESVPPPINEQHAALRKRMQEAHQILRDAENSEARDPVSGIVDSPDARRAAVRSIQIMYEERRLLEAHGVDWRPYQPD
jgi:hypothetical protein